MGAGAPDAGEMTSLATHRPIDSEYTSTLVMRGSADAACGPSTAHTDTTSSITASTRREIADRRASNGRMDAPLAVACPSNLGLRGTCLVRFQRTGVKMIR